MDLRIALYTLVALVTYHQVFCAQHESTESDTIHFYYDNTLHYFIAASRSRCYLVPLERDERDHVHTNIGIEDLEIKMMKEWLGVLPETRIYHDDGHLPTNIMRWCSHQDIYLLERVLNETTTTMATLGG
ncbi:hypothetical protein ACF0H5_012291 [Mactra antiquata]